MKSNPAIFVVFSRKVHRGDVWNLLLFCCGLTLLSGLWVPIARAENDAMAADAVPQVALSLAQEVVAHRLDGPINVDAVLDETTWQQSSAAPLIQNDPENGQPPRLQTDWWVAYDDEALYVACRMYDTAPESICSRLARRDSWPASDMFVLNLDTQNDDRTGYTFAVNPAGTIYDNVMYNDGWDDPSWDGIWDSAARIEENGWVAEFRVPFSQLAFPDREEQVWGINISRRIHRFSGRDELFHRPRGESGYISRFPDLVGIKGVHPEKTLEVLAYTTGKAEYVEIDPDNPFVRSQDYEGNSGLDLRYGLSSNLTLNATINPDFGQVEVDPAVVNLSDFETYFPERRPFFVEDANTFRFGREGTSSNWSFNWSDPIMFYSRRVGRAPQVSLADNDFADRPSATTILGASKLSGKIGSTSVGFLNAITAKETAQIDTEGRISDQIVEPLTSYSVMRLQRTGADGNQGLGVMATNVWRDLTDPRSIAELSRRATTAGIDGWTQLDGDGMWAVRGYLSASAVSGSASSIDELQRSSRRYFQRPTASHVAYDPTRTSLSGWAGRLMLNKEKGNWQLNTAVGAVSPGFEINDLGFQSRADQINTHIGLGHRWVEPTRTFRNRWLSTGIYQSWDCGGTPDNKGVGLFYDGTFTNYWSLGGSFFYNPERNSLRATRGGPIMRLPVNWSSDFWFSSDRRKSVSFGGGIYDSRGTDESEYFSGHLDLTLRPKSSLKITIGPRMSWQKEIAQWVDRVDDASMTATYGARYVFADMDYRKFSLTTRIDWTFTPKLTLQTYLQPLFATADYSLFKEFARPGSYQFSQYGRDNGSRVTYDAENGTYTIDPDGNGAAESFELDDPDFNFKSFKVNLVLRWEYRAGSTLYVVWTQDRANFDHPGDFELGRDMRSLMEAPGDDIIMIKLTHWLDI